MRISILLLVTLLAFSFIALSCASIPKPVGEQCFINATSKYKICYKMHEDFDDSGRLKPDAHGIKYPIGLSDLHKNMCFDIDSSKELQIFISRLREKYKECK